MSEIPAVSYSGAWFTMASYRYGFMVRGVETQGGNR